MKIFITIFGLAPESGGPARSVPSLAQHLSRQDGVDVNLLVLNQPVSALPEPERDGYVTSFFPCNGSGLGKLAALYRMCSTLSRKVEANVGSSIIHDQGIWLLNNHAAVAVAKKTATPVVVSLRGMLEPWALNHKAFKKKAAWNLYQKRDLNSVDLIHATSSQEAANFLKLGLRKPVAIIPNGVDLPPWREPGASNGAQKTLLFLSRIHPKKGLLNLVKAWQLVGKKDWKVIIAGPDEAGHQRDVMDAIQAAGLQKSFEFVGPIDDEAKWDRYFSADLFVLPTFSENFGIVIVEALACGLPVITTTGTPWQELQTHNCGWWVETGAEPLAEALNSAMGLSDLERHDMGLRGRRLVAEHYSWTKIARDMKEAYAWVLGKGPQPDFVVNP